MSGWTCDATNPSGERCVLARGHDGQHATQAQYAAGMQFRATGPTTGGAVKQGFGFGVGCLLLLIVLVVGIPMLLALIGSLS